MVYTKRYRRKRRDDPLLLFIIFAIFIAILAPTGFFSLLYARVVPFLFIIGLLALGVVLLFLFWQKAKKREQLRALQLSDIDHMTGQEFEKYVAEILQTQGYSISLTRTTGDYGGDIVAHKNGITEVFQLKRYRSTVGEEAIQQAVAAKAYYKATVAIVVTNSYFTRFAKELARVNTCELVNRDELAEWIIEFQEKKQHQDHLKYPEN
jgi:restriction system protein